MLPIREYLPSVCDVRTVYSTYYSAVMCTKVCGENMYEIPTLIREVSNPERFFISVLALSREPVARDL